MNLFRHKRLDDLKADVDKSRYTPGAPVLVYDNHIEFPGTVIADEIPAGVYYPAVNKISDRFILTRFNPKTTSSELNNIESLFNELDDSTESVTPSDTHLKNGHTRTIKSRKSYFPMENYHTGFKKVDTCINTFLDSKDFYDLNHIGYKRSVLMYGKPGTGKSRYIDNKCKELIESHNAIVLRIEGYSELSLLLNKGLFYIREKMENRLKVIVIEELATIVQRNDYTELLNFLDHVYLQDNLLFLMTTNTPELIPENIVDRPSRVDILEEIGNDGYTNGFIEAWYTFLMGEEMDESWQKMDFYDKELSPAYLKELFISCKLNRSTIESSWKDIEKRRRKIKTRFKSAGEIGF